MVVDHKIIANHCVTCCLLIIFNVVPIFCYSNITKAASTFVVLFNINYWTVIINVNHVVNLIVLLCHNVVIVAIIQWINTYVVTPFTTYNVNYCKRVYGFPVFLIQFVAFLVVYGIIIHKVVMFAHTNHHNSTHEIGVPQCCLKYYNVMVVKILRNVHLLNMANTVASIVNVVHTKIQNAPVVKFYLIYQIA